MSNRKVTDGNAPSLKAVQPIVVGGEPRLDPVEELCSDMDGVRTGLPALIEAANGRVPVERRKIVSKRHWPTLRSIERWHASVRDGSIIVRMLNGKVLVLAVGMNDATMTLKLCIEDRTGIDPREQRLVYGGKQMKDFLTLFDYGIKSGATLHLALRLCGGCVLGAEDAEPGEAPSSPASPGSPPAQGVGGTSPVAENEVVWDPYADGEEGIVAGADEAYDEAKDCAGFASGFHDDGGEVGAPPQVQEVPPDANGDAGGDGVSVNRALTPERFSVVPPAVQTAIRKAGRGERVSDAAIQEVIRYENSAGATTLDPGRAMDMVRYEAAETAVHFEKVSRLVSREGNGKVSRADFEQDDESAIRRQRSRIGDRHQYPTCDVQIFVKPFAGPVVGLWVGPEDTLGTLQQMLFHRTGIPPDGQRIIFQDVELTEVRTLGSYGVRAGSTLRMALRLRGGAKEDDDDDKATHLAPFDGGEDTWLNWKTIEWAKFAAMKGLTEITQLPIGDKDAYALLAHPAPMVWQDVACTAPCGISNCRDKGANYEHEVVDTSARGKELRRMAAMDAKAGAYLRAALKRGTARNQTLRSEDLGITGEGLGSQIMHRLVQKYKNAGKRAFERVMREIRAVRVEQGLRRSQQISKWWDDIVTLHTELETIVKQDGTLTTVMFNEEQIVQMIRGHAPSAHRGAQHWKTTRDSKTLETFFDTMLQHDQSDESDEKDGELPDTHESRVMAAAQGAPTQTCPPVDDEVPGANGRFQFGRNKGRVVKCWVCDSKDHTKQQCPDYEGPDTGGAGGSNRGRGTGGKGGGGRGRGGGRGGGRGDRSGGGTGSGGGERPQRTRKVCAYWLSDRGCSYGDDCRYYHPPTPQQRKRAAASAGVTSGLFQGTPPGQEGLPDGFQVDPPTLPGGQASDNDSPKYTVSKCRSTGAWIWSTQLMLGAMCMVASLASAQPMGMGQHGNIQNITTSHLPGMSGCTSKTMPRHWRRYFNKAPQVGDHPQLLGKGAGFTAKCAYVGQTKATSAYDPFSSTCASSRYDSQTGTIVEQSRWLFDSGANVNVTSDRTRLSNYRGTSTIKGVEDAAGKVHEVKGVGECMMEVDCGSGGKRIFRIERILYVPTFAMSIVSESWARSVGFGYEAPPTRKWHTPCKLKRYNDSNEVDAAFKLTTFEGLNYIEGKAVNEVTAPVLNFNESTDVSAARQEYRQRHCNLSTAASYKQFEERVHNTTDTEVLTNILDGNDDEGFEEATPKLSAPMRMQVQLRLADLGVLCVEDAAHSPFFVLHHKLGHGGMLETCRLAKSLGIKMPRIEDRWCDACIRAGMTRRPKTKQLRDRSSLDPYEKVFTDICGPFPIRSAYNGYKYIIGFICAKTHEGTIYGMHSMDDVKACTEKYLSWVRNQRVTGKVEVTAVRDGVYDPLGYTTLQSDSHSVYRSAAFKEMVENRFKVELQHSPPHDQSRNGMIERFWRTLGCRARAMMIASSAPTNYWFWAYLQASRVHDLIGTSSNEGRKSPFEMKGGTIVKLKEKLAQLRSFGADCYLWEPSPGKLGEHGRKGKWVGWDDANISNRLHFPKEKGHSESVRTGTHIVMKDAKLPKQVLKGEIGMVFPEYEPLDIADTLDVEIPSDEEIVVRDAMLKNGGVPVNANKTPEPPTQTMTEENGGESTTDSTTTTSTVKDGGESSSPTSQAKDDLELSDISDDDDMMMMNDTHDSTQPQYTMKDTLELRESSRKRGWTSVKHHDVDYDKRDDHKMAKKNKVSFKDKVDGIGKLKTSKSPKFPPLPMIRRILPRRKDMSKETMVGDISVTTANRIIAHARMEHKTTLDDFPIGKLYFDCRKALNSKEYGEQFKASIKKEMDAIDEFKVMHPVLRSEVPSDTKIFNSYMLCHRKSLGHPKWKCKSRLIIDGSNTTPGVHTTEMDISTSMPRWNAVRLLLSAAKGKGWTVKSADVHTAFLRGKSSGITVYMRMPQGMREYRYDDKGVKQEVLQAVTGNLYGKADAVSSVVYTIDMSGIVICVMYDGEIYWTRMCVLFIICIIIWCA